MSKRGTNALRAASRIYFTNDDLQGENISNAEKAAGLSGNRIQQLAEYGGDVGGPVRNNRSGSGPASRETTFGSWRSTAFPDNGASTPRRREAMRRLGAATRLSFLYHRAEKVKTGRLPGRDRPPETT